MDQNYTRDYGYKNFRGTGLSDDILASDKMQIITILIDSATRDTGHTGSTEDLRRGLVLYFDTTDERYKELTLAAQSPRAYGMIQVSSLSSSRLLLRHTKTEYCVRSLAACSSV